MMKWWYM